MTENASPPAESVREAMQRGMLLAFERQLGNGSRGMVWLMGGVLLWCITCVTVLVSAYGINLSLFEQESEFLLGASGAILAGLMGASWCAELPGRVVPSGGLWLRVSWGLFFVGCLMLVAPGWFPFTVGLVLVTASYVLWLLYLRRVAYALDGQEALRLVQWWAILLGIFGAVLLWLAIYVKTLWPEYAFHFRMVPDTLAATKALTYFEWFCFGLWCVAVLGSAQMIMLWRMRELIRQRMKDWVESEGKMEIGGQRKETPGVLPVRIVMEVEEEDLTPRGKAGSLKRRDFISRNRGRRK